MKYKLIIDPSLEEELIIIANKEKAIFKEIEKMILSEQQQIVGYLNDEIIILNKDEICCFISENNKVYALLNNNKYLIKKRLYQIDESIGKNYIKINQSCIANISQIKKFVATFDGSLQVIFKNGYKDYISRRELKNVKERLGI